MATAYSDDDDDDVTRIMHPGDHAIMSDRPAPSSGHRWTVQVNEHDTRPMTANEIVQAFASGALGDGVSVWKNGMASWASISDVPELMEAIEQSGRQPRPGSTKPPPPQRAGTTTGQFPVAGSTKPPPPVRGKTQAAAAGASAPKKPGNVSAAGALDPSASSSDFYSKLLSKVGPAKAKTSTQSSPPVEVPPKRTQPPTRESSLPGAHHASGRPGAMRSDAPTGHGVAANIDPDAAPSDFYAKILAKVRPQSAPPAAPTEVKPTTERHTLPPAWGAAPAAEKPAAPPVAPPRAPAVATAPIRVVRAAPPPPSPGPPPAPTSVAPPAAPVPFSHTTADGLGDIEVHVDVPASASVPVNPFAAAAAVRPDPVAPRRADSSPPASIQLPPLTTTSGDQRLPAAVSPVIARIGSVPPPPTSTPAPMSRQAAPPSAETSAQAAAQPRLVESYTPQPQPRRRVAGIIIAVVGVGLLGVGGGVAATIYTLKSSMRRSIAPSPSAAVAAAVSAPAAVTPPTAPPATPAPQAPAAAAAAQAAASPSQVTAAEKPPSDVTSSGRSPAAKAVHVVAAATPAAGADTPKVDSSKASKTAAVPAAPVEPAVPSFLDTKSSAKKSIAAEAKLPPAPVDTKPAAKTTAGSGPFPKDVAQAMLGIAASQAPACKKPGGPTGTGKAIVTFDTDGSVVITNIVGEGFAGTPTGQCVAGLFRRVRVPPFGGDRATTSKIFTIPP